MGESVYNEKLEALNSQFNSVLDDYKKYYVFFNKNPDYKAYQTAYTEAKAHVQNINSQVLKISSEVDVQLNKLLHDAKNINKKIVEEKKSHSKMTKNLGLLKMDKNGSNAMIDNYKELYKEQYIKNVTTFLGIFLATFIVIRVYKKTGP
jgi:hypothetical protein